MSSPARQALDALADETGESIVVADGYDAALIGTATVFCGHSWGYRAIYDRAKVIQILIASSEMSEEEAEEFFEFNIQGAIIPGAPVFINLLPIQTA
jgi:hypothetical protein